MTRIVNVRGTNGSGKTTLARALISRLNFNKNYTTKNGVATQVYVNPHTQDNVIFIGTYDGPVCGGVDKVKSVRDLVEATAEVSEFADVFMEGLILSSLQQLAKDIADASAAHATFHAITLSTSKEQCIAQTLKRRELAGNEKPFDPAKSLLPKYRAVELAAAKLKSWGMDSVVLSQRDAFKASCALLNIPYDPANAL